MSGIKGFFIYEITLAAGASETINCQGEFFNVLESDQAAFLIGTDEGRLCRVEQGYKWRAAPGEGYNRVYFENLSAVDPLTVSVALGFGDLEDSQTSVAGGVTLTGAVEIAPAADVCAVSSVNVTDAATQILAADADRTGGVVYAGTEDLWIGPDNTVTAAGPVYIPAGASLSFGHKGAIYGIRAAGLAADAGAYVERDTV